MGYTVGGVEYLNRRSITVSESLVGTVAANFPASVFPPSLAGKVLGNFNDAVFTAADGSTLADWHWESKVAAAPVGTFEVPASFVAEDVVGYLYYNVIGSDPGDQSDEAGTFSSLVARYGMADASGTVTDSTGNYNSMAETNLTYAQTGQIADAIEFNGSDSNAVLGDITQLNSVAAFSLSFWMNPTSYQFGEIFRKVAGGANNIVLRTFTSDRILCYIENSSESYASLSSAQTYAPVSVWSHIAIVYDGGGAANADRLKLYINGTNISWSSFVGTIPSTTPNMPTYDALLGSTSNVFDGDLDEFRIASAARTADWVKAEYLAGADTLFTFGAEETGPPKNDPWHLPDYAYRDDLVANAVGIIGTATSPSLRVRIPGAAAPDGLDLALKVEDDLRDIRFVTRAGVAIPHDLTLANRAGDSFGQLLIDEIVGETNDSYWWMYYGYGSAASAETVDAYAPAVAYYTMDDASGTVVDALGNYNSTAETNLTYGQTGSLNEAIEFNGNDSNAVLGDVTQLNSVAAFSISFWMNQDVLDQSDTIFEKHLSSTARIAIVTYTGGQMYFRICNGADVNGWFDYSAVIGAGAWHHVSMVFDGGGATAADKLKAYVDGVQQTLSLGAIPATTADLSGQDAMIGRFAGAFDGKLDEFRIDAAALDAQTVALIARASAAELFTWGREQAQ